MPTISNTLGQYIFAGVISVLLLASTTWLVSLELLDATAFTFVAGGIMGGTFGALNPRQQQRSPSMRTRSSDSEEG